MTYNSMKRLQSKAIQNSFLHHQFIIMVDVEITRKKVMIVEDSDVIRKRIKGLLSELENVDVIAEADCATDAIKFGIKHLPDVMILDINLLGSDTGFLVLKEMKRIHPSLITIVLTNYASPQYKNKSSEFGADYFFDKSNEFDDMVKCFNWI